MLNVLAVPVAGLVSTLYISQWQYPTSNLREMAQVGGGGGARSVC